MRLIPPRVSKLASQNDPEALGRELDRYRHKSLSGILGPWRWSRCRKLIDALAMMGQPASIPLLGIVFGRDVWKKRRYAAQALADVPGTAEELAAEIRVRLPGPAPGEPDPLPTFTAALVDRDLRTKALCAWALLRNKAPDAPALFQSCLPWIEATIARLSARPAFGSLAATGAAPLAHGTMAKILDKLVKEGAEVGAEAAVERLGIGDLDLEPDASPDLGDDP